MDKPVVDPPTPYLGAVPGGFGAGKMVRIQGYVPPTGERFNINFQAGPAVEPRDDVGLHLSVRLLEGYVARNTLQSGMWGEEQDAGDLPIQPGQKFEVIVLSDKSQYKVAINGRHFCEFPQRFPASDVTHLSIDGDVSLSVISFESDLPLEARAPSQAQTHAGYGPPPSAPDAYGPPPSGPDGYGPPPGGYGPPGGGYGPPGGGYGPPPPGQYQPPPPPGYPQDNKEGEFGSLLETAGTVLAGAIRSGAAEKLLSSFTGGGANQQQQQQQQQHQYQPQPPPQQSQDSLGGLGSLLSSFAGGQNTQPQQQTQAQGGDVLSGLGSLISTFSGGQNTQQPPPQPQPQQQATQGGGDLLSGLGSLISTFAGPTNQQQQQQHPQQPPPQHEQYQNQANYGPPQSGGQQPPPVQSGGADIIGGLSSLLSTLSTHQTQPQAPQPQPALNPSQLGGHGSIGGLGSMAPILTSLAGQIITNPPKEDGKN